MNKLIVALIANAFPGSVMTAVVQKVDTRKSAAPSATAAAEIEKPADAIKTACKHHGKKAAHHSHKKSAAWASGEVILGSCRRLTFCKCGVSLRFYDFNLKEQDSLAF